MMLPKKALSRPPSAPGGGVICVKMDHFIADTPLMKAVHRIHASQNKPNTVAARDSNSAIAFLMRRRRYRFSIVTAMSIARAPGQLHQHVFGDCQHDEGD